MGKNRLFRLRTWENKSNRKKKSQTVYLKRQIFTQTRGKNISQFLAALKNQIRSSLHEYQFSIIRQEDFGSKKYPLNTQTVI